MNYSENKFLDTVLNSPENVKKFLIDNGNEGKSTCPIYFFSEEEREKYIRKSDESKS